FLDIQRIFVSKAYRNKGIGTYFIKKFENETKKKKVNLEVWKGNPAIKLYKKLGYKIIKYNNGKYQMQKLLTK
ncbi:GNAT family N-acetyltransferase, partial [Candidatus Pacearchaeota archaeon]|nr:GNAT family N-acetyltransferase [Candidatus Pacearchaeota archaeon]MBD3282743.1 GNAT family N-acetyltransferase [Candidatus Pacearchaeota archaeon]